VGVEAYMRVGILAGGVGSRIVEETETRPKPMVEIGGRPILWHIMKHYAHYGFKDFVVALGYKGDDIKRYFLDYFSVNKDLTVELGTGRVTTKNGDGEDWRVELVDTGLRTATGGRIRRLVPYMEGTFFMTWGDGVADLDLLRLLEFHKSHGRLATVTAVRPPARFGKIDLDGDQVTRFSEKPQLEEGWINGAFFVLEPEVGEYIDGDSTQFEREPLERLAKDGELMAFRHDGFWQCMDTLRDRKRLQELWEAEAPWRIWD
jgi:glucose-1-phosphate cytidylyltransferase